MTDKSEEAGEITLLLEDWARGNPGAVDQLLPLVYDQLRRVAQSLLRNERADHTLECTALVNELFGQLLRQRRVNMKDRGHFYTFSAKLMRRLLIDHARQFRAAKRGGSLARVPLEAELAWVRTARGELDRPVARARRTRGAEPGKGAGGGIALLSGMHGGRSGGTARRLQIERRPRSAVLAGLAAPAPAPSSVTHSQWRLRRTSI